MPLGEPPLLGRFSMGSHYNTSKPMAHGNPTLFGLIFGPFPHPPLPSHKPLVNTYTLKFGLGSHIISISPLISYNLTPNWCSLDGYTISRSGEPELRLGLLTFQTGGPVHGLPLSVRSLLTLPVFQSDGLTFLTSYLRLLSFHVRAPLAQRPKVYKVVTISQWEIMLKFGSVNVIKSLWLVIVIMPVNSHIY